MVCLSSVAKRPLTCALRWMLKEVRNYNAKVKEASDTENGQAYLGKTPLSLFVCGKAEELDAEINELVEEAAYVDDKRWGKVFFLMPLELHDVARQLMITLILVQKCNWFFRMMKRVRLRYTSFHSYTSKQTVINFFISRLRENIKTKTR